MDLTSKQRRYLKGEAHHLKPVVQVGGRGIVQDVIDKVDMELECHELIKVRVADDDRQARALMAERVVEQTGCALVQTIGKTWIMYRPRKKKPTIRLPKA